MHRTFDDMPPNATGQRTDRMSIGEFRFRLGQASATGRNELHMEAVPARQLNRFPVLRSELHGIVPCALDGSAHELIIAAPRTLAVHALPSDGSSASTSSISIQGRYAGCARWVKFKRAGSSR